MDDFCLLPTNDVEQPSQGRTQNRLNMRMCVGVYLCVRGSIYGLCGIGLMLRSVFLSFLIGNRARKGMKKHIQHSLPAKCLKIVDLSR